MGETTTIGIDLAKSVFQLHGVTADGIEMYLAGVSVRRVEDITEALWGTRVSPSTVSNLNKKIYAKIEAWRNRPIEGKHPYVFLDGIVMKRTWAG
jgi:transposase-like protein